MRNKKKNRHNIFTKKYVINTALLVGEIKNELLKQVTKVAYVKDYKKSRVMIHSKVDKIDACFLIYMSKVLKMSRSITLNLENAIVYRNKYIDKIIEHCIRSFSQVYYLFNKFKRINKVKKGIITVLNMMPIARMRNVNPKKLIEIVKYYKIVFENEDKQKYISDLILGLEKNAKTEVVYEKSYHDMYMSKIERIEPELERKNKIKGKTLLIADVSGSMNYHAMLNLESTRSNNCSIGTCLILDIIKNTSDLSMVITSGSDGSNTVKSKVQDVSKITDFRSFIKEMKVAYEECGNGGQFVYQCLYECKNTLFKDVEFDRIIFVGDGLTSTDFINETKNKLDFYGKYNYIINIHYDGDESSHEQYDGPQTLWMNVNLESKLSNIVDYIVNYEKLT